MKNFTWVARVNLTSRKIIYFNSCGVNSQNFGHETDFTLIRYLYEPPKITEFTFLIKRNRKYLKTQRICSSCKKAMFLLSRVKSGGYRQSMHVILSFVTMSHRLISSLFGLQQAETKFSKGRLNFGGH